MRALFFAVLLTTFLLNGCGSQGGDNEDDIPISSYLVKGVWWWHSNLITDDCYLYFAIDNNINEIYLSIKYPANADEFIEKAYAKGVKVFWLIGDYRYVDDDRELFDILEWFKTYQATAPLNRRFAGVHLDIEPNQHLDFTTRRQELLEAYLALIIRVSDTMPIDIDIPASFDDLVAYKGQNMPLYKALISEANRTFVMSYRDSAKAMYELAEDEINAAKALNKTIVLGAETEHSNEGEHVSYYEEGKQYMNEQLNELKSYSVGISIHHIKSWFELRE